MSYDLNKLVKLSTLQELAQRIKNLFATKEEVQNLKTLPNYNNSSAQRTFLKVNEKNELEWNRYIEDLDVNNITIFTRQIDPSQYITFVTLYADGSVIQPILRAECDAGIYPIIRDIASPIQSRDVANKEYVDNNTPLLITFSGTSQNHNATCDTSWEVIKQNIENNRPIKARYNFSSNSYFDLQLTYNPNNLSGTYINYANLQDLSEGYIYCLVNFNNSELNISYEEV